MFIFSPKALIRICKLKEHFNKNCWVTGVQVAHAGRCVKEMKIKETCPSECPTTKEGNKICGSDGNTYP